MRSLPVLLVAWLVMTCAGHRAFGQAQTTEASVSVTTSTLKAFLAAFNAHDLDAIMGFFAEDCEFYMPPIVRVRDKKAGVYGTVTRRGRLAVGQPVFFEPAPDRGEHLWIDRNFVR